MAVIGKRDQARDAPPRPPHMWPATCAATTSAPATCRRSNAQWTRGKAIDTFLPCGPWLVTADEVGDPQALWLRCEVNGERLQDSRTSRTDLVSGASW